MQNRDLKRALKIHYKVNWEDYEIGKITKTKRKMKKLIEQGVYRVVDNFLRTSKYRTVRHREYKGLVYQYNKVQLIDGRTSTQL